MHIILTNFEETAFGKTSTTIGFSKEKHPFNLLYLAWELHNGYNESNKESPLGMKAKHIQSLYQSLLGQHFSKYQQPLRTRWFYELEAAQQYLERRSLHIEFASWFISKLKSRKKTSKLYIEKWELFFNWLKDPFLNIQIECLVQFGLQFYKPFAQFIAGYDPTPRILDKNKKLKSLPAGHRAHQMPDAIIKMTFDLKKISDNIYNFFGKELLDATIKLSNDDFSELINGLQNGVKKALELNEKWLSCWFHLPLSICWLGGSHGKQFARSFAYIMLGENWKQVPTLCEILYANYLRIDLENNNINDFGLMEALKDQTFYMEFSQFAQSDEGQLHDYLNLYEWVKHRIWYIVIHQQQIEGIFNIYDLKTHPNMSFETKKAKLRLAKTSLNELNFTNKELQKTYQTVNKSTQQYINLESNINQQAADEIFKTLFCRDN